MKFLKMSRVSAITGAALLLLSLASCTTDNGAVAGKVHIGVVVPLSGAYEEPGNDVKDAFQTYIKANGGKLGGREVDVSIADEGDTPKTSLPSTKRLLDKDKVDVLVGGGTGINFMKEAPEATKHKVPFVGIGGTPDLKASGVPLDWVWQASYLISQAGEAIAPYMKDNIDGPVYAMGPDYDGGHFIVGSFVTPFSKLGGNLANPGGKPAWTPWPKTSDFSKYFDEAAQSNAKAIFAYYAGQPSVDFVQQWAKSAAKDIPLYGIYLTEGSALNAQGKSAKGVRTVQNYSPTIDNPANRKFVSDWSASHDGQTNGFTLSGWDAALLLDQAIGNIPKDQKVTPAKINTKISQLGKIDSPRGTWQFSSTHTPIQKWYLNEVENDGHALSNVVLQDLATLGQ